MRTLSLLLAGLALTTGCDTTTCTNLSVPAVEVTLTTEGDVFIVNPVVTWSGSGFADEPCLQDADDPNLWTCGHDQDGPIVVTATSESHEPGEAQADVPMDAEECHPDTVSLTLALEPQMG